MPTGPRRDEVEASSGLKKGSNGEGSSGVKKKGHIVKKVSTASKKKVRSFPPLSPFPLIAIYFFRWKKLPLNTVSKQIPGHQNSYMI